MSKTVKASFFLVLQAAWAVWLPGAAFAQQQAQKTVSSIQVEVIYLEKSGCHPAQITRPQGEQFRLWVVNKSGDKNVQLSLQAVSAPGAGVQPAGSTVVQSAKTFTPTDTHWLQLLNLPAGTYTLTAPGAQTFGCKIVLH
jgi:hypothetical protein